MYDVELNLHKIERAYLVGCVLPGDNRDDAAYHLQELAMLVGNLGVAVAGSNLVGLRKRNAKLFVGKGKAEEIAQKSRELEADIVVFDEALSPSQQRNWESLFEVFAIDRSEIILDVFSQRAQTREACLQIALAKEKYALPRLTNAWTHLSRQYGGGTGQRGVGEKQLELDRRIVSRNIQRLTSELEKVRRQRETQRKKRRKSPYPNAAIVGYTNAGKSTLMNLLTGSEVYVADKLFATLDPATKPLTLPNKQKMLLTDTVGFIHKLPHLLVESFKATLEEAVYADVLVHIVDAGSPYAAENHATTLGVLDELNVGEDKPFIQVFNKVDTLDDPLKRVAIKNQFPDAVLASFKTGEGVDQLLQRMAALLDDCLKSVSISVPQKRADIIALLHRTCQIESEEYQDHCVLISARVPPVVYKEIAPFIQK